MYLTSSGTKHSIVRDLLTEQNPHVGETQGKEVESHHVLLVNCTTPIFMWIGYTESINLNYLFR